MVDFNPQPMAVQLSAASPVACVRIPIVNDIIRDPDEVFEVELTTPFARAVVSPQLRVADVVITDNDDGKTYIIHHSQTHGNNDNRGIKKNKKKVTNFKSVFHSQRLRPYTSKYNLLCWRVNRMQRFVWQSFLQLSIP